MLTFLVRCTHVGCYVTEGLGDDVMMMVMTMMMKMKMKIR